jgi:glutamate formiminotransferase
VLYSLIVGCRDPLIAFNAALHSCVSALSRQLISSIALYTQLVTNIQKSAENHISEALVVAGHLTHNIEKYSNVCVPLPVAMHRC